LTAWLNFCLGPIGLKHRPSLEWQFVGKSKYFRPLTIFGCYRAVSNERIPDTIIRSAAVLEMMHNVSLIIDDIVDESDERRGKATLHRKFGLLSGLMAPGYIAADGFRMSAEDPHDFPAVFRPPSSTPLRLPRSRDR
jgi:geranylgeranyl diphosphate synthase type I